MTSQHTRGGGGTKDEQKGINCPLLWAQRFFTLLLTFIIITRLQLFSFRHIAVINPLWMCVG